jgi:hypothetical protein
MERGVAYLKKQQSKGNWELGLGGFTYKGGSTALVMLALMTAGVKPTDPAIQKGLVYLRKIKPSQNYVVALQTLAFLRAGEKADRKRIGRNVKWLLEARHEDGWAYTRPAARGSRGADNSNSQYALLALHEARRAGDKVDAKALAAMHKLYLKSQIAGGWGYKPKIRASMAMTTAGLASLLITTNTEVKLRKDGSVAGCGIPDAKSVAAALEWIGKGLPDKLTEKTAMDFSPSPFYALYGLARAAPLTGHRYLGGHDWYAVGSRYLLSVQKKDGSWQGRGGRFQLDGWPQVATSFALLFLSSGRTPVLVTKFAHGAANSTDWCNHRHDLRHLVAFAGKELFRGRRLTWDSVDLRRMAAPNRAAQRKWAAVIGTPVVFISGHNTAARGKEAAILKEYVGQGGFILAEACCGDRRFDKNFRAFVRRTFAVALKRLPANHAVYRALAKYKVTAKDFPLEGVDLGGRTVLIYSPKPLAGYWAANAFARGRGQKAFRLGCAIIEYATGRKMPARRVVRK